MSGGHQQQWVPNTSLEQGKLAAKERDWNLAGAAEDATPTRTRSGGNGRPNLSRNFFGGSSLTMNGFWSSNMFATS